MARRAFKTGTAACAYPFLAHCELFDAVRPDDGLPDARLPEDRRDDSRFDVDFRAVLRDVERFDADLRDDDFDDDLRPDDFDDDLRPVDFDDDLRPDDFDDDLRPDDFDDDFFEGTFAPALRASDKPIAIACLRLFTFLPECPLRSSPVLRSCIASRTDDCAFLPYLAISLCSSGWVDR